MGQDGWGSRSRSERRRLGLALAIAIAAVSVGLPAALHAEESQDFAPEADGVGAEALLVEDGAETPPAEVTVPPEDTTVPPEDPGSAPAVEVPADPGSSGDDTGTEIEPAAADPNGSDPRQPAEDAGPRELQVSALRAQPKVTICHRTSSETNPIVEITIAIAALPAHIAHGDIYPVPEGGCPTAEESVDICHATGDEAEPFEVITVPVGELATHLGHGDIFPVPDDGCPVLETEPEGGGGSDDPDEGGVSPAHDGGSGEPSASPPSNEDGLPFTGLSVSTMLLLGSVLVFLGWALRVIYGPAPAGRRFALPGVTLDQSVERVPWDEISPERDSHREDSRGRESAKATVAAVTLAGVAAAYLGWLLNRD